MPSNKGKSKASAATNCALARETKKHFTEFKPHYGKIRSSLAEWSADHLSAGGNTTTSSVAQTVPTREEAGSETLSTPSIGQDQQAHSNAMDMTVRHSKWYIQEFTRLHDEILRADPDHNRTLPLALATTDDGAKWLLQKVDEDDSEESESENGREGAETISGASCPGCTSDGVARTAHAKSVLERRMTWSRRRNDELASYVAQTLSKTDEDARTQFHDEMTKRLGISVEADLSQFQDVAEAESTVVFPWKLIKALAGLELSQPDSSMPQVVVTSDTLSTGSVGQGSSGTTPAAQAIDTSLLYVGRKPAPKKRRR